MEGYGIQVERMIKRLGQTLSEKDRRRYAAVEAVKFGHGGSEYVAGLLGCDRETIDQSRVDFGIWGRPGGKTCPKRSGSSSTIHISLIILPAK